MTERKTNGQVLPRVRLGGVVVQLQAFVEDGDDLRPLQVQPLPMSVAEFRTFDIDEARKRLIAEYEAAEGL